MDPLFFGSIVAGLYFLYGRWKRKPTHAAEWQVDYEMLPRIQELPDGRKKVCKLRDWKYDHEGRIVDLSVTDLEVDPQNIVQVWVALEPFILWNKIAHTFVIFELQDATTLCVSVEARRRKSQGFSPIMGFLKSYELLYQWGTERDLLAIRALRRKHTLGLIPLKLTQEAKTDLFQAVCEATNELYDHPRFYNTLVTNCTTELFDPIAKIHKEFHLPRSARVFTAHVFDLLVERKLVDASWDIEKLRNISPTIKDFSKEILEHDDPRIFSKKLRGALRA